MAEHVTQAEYEALAELRYAIREFLRFSEAAAEEAGLTPRQHQALLAIRGAPGGIASTVGDLARRLHLRHHSAVGLVDRLAARGLVVRRRAAPDRRRVRVALTGGGRRVLARLSSIHRGELRRLGPRLRGLLTALTEE
jgi:DNA-binding MarR family transcriptional regulator